MDKLDIQVKNEHQLDVGKYVVSVLFIRHFHSKPTQKNLLRYNREISG